eukprot:scaffold58328_cov69-Phaeocystis_antarctica.AAC.1
MMVSMHLSPELRRKREHWRVIGLLPVLKFATKAIAQQETSKRQRQSLLEVCLDSILRVWKEVQLEGIEMVDAAGVVSLVRPYVGIVLADNVDIWALSRVVGGDCAACTRCKGSLLDTGVAPLRSTESEKPLVMRALNLIEQLKQPALTAVAKRGIKQDLASALLVLKGRGLHPLRNVLWQLFPYTDGYRSFGWPLLHNCQKGVLEKLMLLALLRIHSRLGQSEAEASDGSNDESEEG